jgi:hypothetical protein
MSQTCKAEGPWPTEEEIRKHAYEIYLARRSDESGNDLDDWLRAESQLRSAGKRAMQLGKV